MCVFYFMWDPTLYFFNSHNTSSKSHDLVFSIPTFQFLPTSR